ncbi:NAD(P)-binding protein [Meredithblackwellia eburnea MCA 4105]
MQPFSQLARSSTSPLRRHFSTSIQIHAGQTGPQSTRAVVFASHGDPTQVLRGHSYELPQLSKGQVRVKFELSAINPADINVIQGVYPSKPAVRKDIGPEPLSIMGNEGVGRVEGFEEDGEVEKVLKVGDRVVMGSAQLGTWQSYSNLPFKSLIPISSNPSLTAAQAGTISINPPTALRMLADYIPLDPTSPRHNELKGKKQWVIQNGANSAVGIAAIQLAKAWGVGTINLVRDRPDLEGLKGELKALGADHVLSYEEFLEDPKATRSKIKEWTSGGSLRLALNCVGGKETTEMCKLLDLEGVLVTYGGMAKQSLKIPPSLFIFKKLQLAGFWYSNWVETHPEERITMMKSLAQLIADGKLKEPAHEIVDLEGDDEKLGVTVREVMKKLEDGRAKKQLLRFV